MLLLLEQRYVFLFCSSMNKIEFLPNCIKRNKFMNSTVVFVIMLHLFFRRDKRKRRQQLTLCFAGTSMLYCIQYHCIIVFVSICSFSSFLGNHVQYYNAVFVMIWQATNKNPENTSSRLVYNGGE